MRLDCMGIKSEYNFMSLANVDITMALLKQFTLLVKISFTTARLCMYTK